jgi:hypothetical protein
VAEGVALRSLNTTSTQATWSSAPSSGSFSNTGEALVAILKPSGACHANNSAKPIGTENLSHQMTTLSYSSTLTSAPMSYS